MLDVQPGASAASPQPVTLLFITRQQLLAETLGRAITAWEGWASVVLDHDHPHLLDDASVINPSVVVLDVDTHVLPGLDLLSHLVVLLPTAAVLVLGELTAVTTAEAMRRGARGCITYDGSPEEVRAAVVAAAEGRTAFGAAALHGLVTTRRVARPQGGGTVSNQTLSAREVDVLRRLAAGRSSRDIAAELGISVDTVRKHTQNVLRKLGVHSKLQAAALAVRDGLV